MGWSARNGDRLRISAPQRPISHVALAVEVADTTLRHDALRKRDLYARAGVPEYLVLDLDGRRLIVHRQLDAERGEYVSIQSYAEAEAVSLNSPAGHTIAVSSLLP
jgi:Uma2 family endonuclease